ncbi:relaxase/mobilization nuclease domain-containing protein [Oscillospiraceae bacterium 44-34]
MAYDKIITVRSRLDHCVDYVLNHEKTDMAAVLDYIGRADKNILPDGRSVLETAINCDLESAYQDMQETKRRWGKPGGVLGYHLIHAFAPGEVTPEQAHEIGVEFAARLLGDRYEAVVSTHLDRDHLHCHILFNSVSFVDGAKYKNTFKDYFGDIRGISNEVSRAHGLSVIEPGEGGRHYAEWDAEAQGRPTLRSLVRQDIDAAIASAYTMKTFWKQLEELGYTIKRGANVKHTAVRPPGGQRFFRLDGLGDGYTEADIQTRLSATRSGETPPPVSSAPSLRPTIQPLTPGRRYRPRGGIPRRPRKLKGFRALYFKCLYLLGAIPKRHPRHRAAFVSRTEIIKFDRYQKQFQYLMKNRIETANQLSMQYDALQAQIDALTDQRRELYKIRRAGHGGDAVTDEITGLTARVRELRRELKLCARIERDIPTVKEAVQADTSETRSVIHEKTDKSRPQRHFETGRSLSGGGGPGR